MAFQFTTISVAEDFDNGYGSLNKTTSEKPLDALKNRSPKKRWAELKQSLQTKQSPFRTYIGKARASKNESAAEPEDPFFQPIIVDEQSGSATAHSAIQQKSSKPKTFVNFFNGLKSHSKNDPTVPLPPVDIEEPTTVIAQLDEESYSEPISDPLQLKKISNILPYFDYEPDPKAAATDPCKFLCPRPDGLPCKPLAEGERVPECPKELSLGDEVYETRSFDDLMFMWEASNIYYNPLYFEDATLERYGHTHHELVQPFVSTAKFGVQLLGLPYQMTIDPICKRRYPLGYYRPGECVPYLYHQIPWNTKAAVVQAGVVTGLIFAIP